MFCLFIFRIAFRDFYLKNRAICNYLRIYFQSNCTIYEFSTIVDNCDMHKSTPSYKLTCIC